jgi:hypothetical protein
MPAAARYCHSNPSRVSYRPIYPARRRDAQRQAGIKDEKVPAPLSANMLNELSSRSNLGKALRDFDAAAAEIIGKQGNTDNPSTPIAPTTIKR